VTPPKTLTLPVIDTEPVAKNEPLNTIVSMLELNTVVPALPDNIVEPVTVKPPLMETVWFNGLTNEAVDAKEELP
jgi:hypothetical protein